MNLDRYLQIRRPIEVGFWVAFFTLNVASETLVLAMDADRNNLSVNNWELAAWEATSAIAILLLLPLILYFDNRFALGWKNLKVTVPAHLGFSLVFSVLHINMMVAMRKWLYWINGSSYDYGIIHQQFLYEYLKDARTYALILALIYLYRYLVLRLQGEATLLGSSDLADKKEVEPNQERILVKKLGREFLVKISDIEHIEASGNYVNLHVAKRVYPLRETLKKIEQRLDDATFKRIHRSYIINLNQVAEIKPLESGDAHVLLNNGEVVPMSRTYRTQFFDSRW
jgi:hypothetical protein